MTALEIVHVVLGSIVVLLAVIALIYQLKSWRLSRGGEFFISTKYKAISDIFLCAAAAISTIGLSFKDLSYPWLLIGIFATALLAFAAIRSIKKYNVLKACCLKGSLSLFIKFED